MPSRWWNNRQLQVPVNEITVMWTWWRHQMETFSALLAICAGNSPVSGEFPAQRLVTRSFDVFFDLCLNKRLSKQSWGWWFEKLWRPLWRHHYEKQNVSQVWPVHYQPVSRTVVVIILLEILLVESSGEIGFTHRILVRDSIICANGN